ncbi:MAG TPA: hypothetical protein VK308_04810 [Pyrinomonadaceae bacterium]|nr:hypothetical protein [Pyrinomonadaceae bacterium]
MKINKSYANAENRQVQTIVVSAMTTLVAVREPILRMRRHTRSLKCAAEDSGH